MREPTSKLPSKRSGCVTPGAVLTCTVVLPLLLALTGCGGNAASQVNGGSSGAGPGAMGQAGGPDLMVGPPGSSGGATSGPGGPGSGDAGMGAYMLPAGFTKAQMGGFKLGDPVDPNSMGAAGSGAAGGSSSSCGTQILGVVRDFKGANEKGGHPDFEAFSGVDESIGIVKDALGADQKPEYSQPANSPFIDMALPTTDAQGKPVVDAMGMPVLDAANGQQTTDKAHFDEWYRGTPNVNKPYVVYFYFEPNNGVLTFQSNAFFPLDGAGWGNTPKWPHNFGFTTEVHTQFSYKGKETFAFTGDDDLWVFINHKLAIDLGGLHSQRTKKISLDMEAAKLGIAVGGTYDLDLFHAERHTDASNFRVDTNLAFTNCGTIIEEPPVR